MQFLDVFKISNVESHVSRSFYPSPSQAYAEICLSLGKCSSPCTSLNVFIQEAMSKC